jgi:hypothetical protein
MLGFMPLTFEPDVRFNVVTNAAYLWADVEGGGRFKLVITRNHLRRYGLRSQFDDKRAREVIAEHRADLEAKAAVAHAQGEAELVLD